MGATNSVDTQDENAFSPLGKGVVLFVLLLTGILLNRYTNPYFALSGIITLSWSARGRMGWKANPLTVRKLKRFKAIKRGSASFNILLLLWIFSLFAEFFISNS